MRSDIKSLAEYLWDELPPQNVLAAKNVSVSDLYDAVDYWLQQQGYEFAGTGEIDSLRNENEGLYEDLARKQIEIDELKERKFIIAVEVSPDGVLGEVYQNLPNETALIVVEQGANPPDAYVTMVTKTPAEGDLKEFLYNIIADATDDDVADGIMEVLNGYDY